MKNSSEPTILVKITTPKGNVIRIRSKKTKRIFHFLKAENFLKCVFEVRVNYGDGYENSGTYFSKSDTTKVLKIFLEK